MEEHLKIKDNLKSEIFYVYVNILYEIRSYMVNSDYSN